jgi:protocatechuate 3,4-dioxygenase beta subunit
MIIDVGRPRRQGRLLRPGRLLALALVGLAAATGLLVTHAGAAGAAGVCPSVNRPNMLRLVSGSPQTAQLEKPFQTNLQVELANSNGCPLTGRLAGIWVDFTAPGEGPSGTFATSGTNHVTVGTDATGVATAPTFTANGTAGSYTVQADSDYGSALFYLSNTASGVPASITASGTTSQQQSVNSQYGQPLQAQVTDANGRPVQGVTVTFSLGTGPTGAGASFLGGGAQATDTTKSDGQATSPPFVANGTPGRFTATASISGVAAVATYTLINHAAGNTLTALNPAQTVTVKTRYRQPLKARVRDASGQPIEGASVTFTLTTAPGGAGATFPDGSSQASALSDATGQATSPRVVANKTAGHFTATAAVTGTAKSVSYSLLNLAGRPATITAGGASGEATPVGTRFPIPLAVTVKDADDNPVAGVVVTFAVPARGPSGHFRSHARTVRVKTDSKGIAVAPALTANDTPGGYVATATAGELHAAFALINQPRR